MLNFQVINDPDEWENIKEDWNTLLKKSVTHVPFLRYEFLRQWWNTCGGGEWEKGDLMIITARDGEKLVGIAPLFYRLCADEKPVLMLIGSYEILDYLDFLVMPEYQDLFISGLFSFLTTSEVSEWQALDLYNILDYSSTLKAIGKAASAVGWKIEQTQLQKAPYIPLPGDWEHYLAGIDKKQRHEIRRKMRRLAESEHPNRWYIVDDPNELNDAIESFLLLMEQDDEKKAFLTPAMRNQMQATMLCAFDAGFLHLAFLEIDGIKVAGYFSFHYLNRLWVYNSGLNRDYNEFSPGWVLLGHLLQWANEDKLDEFDFLRGDENYKYKFGAIDRAVVRLRITR